MNKKIFFAVIAICICLFSLLANAGESTQPQPKLEKEQIYQLIKDKGYRCLECHDVDKKVVGPAWKEVAAKRRNHKWAHEMLVFRISAGSMGEYGTVEMPHNEVQGDDVRVIVDWILSLWDPSPSDIN